MNDEAEQGPGRRRVDSIAYLHAAATLACVETGLRYRIERSDRSEAFYVKVFRPGSPSPLGGAHTHDAPPSGDGEPGRTAGDWWGTRVACHLPVYRCSQEYAQVHVPKFAADPAELADARRELERHIATGGVVVADPDEVREAMFAAFRASRSGTEAAGPAGTRWRWRERTLRWRLISVDGVSAADLPADLRRAVARFTPPDAPDAHLPPREQSAIRSRLNRRARWAWEERLATDAARATGGTLANR